MTGFPRPGRRTCLSLTERTSPSFTIAQHTVLHIFIAALAGFVLVPTPAQASTAVHVSISPTQPNVFSALTQQFTADVANSTNTAVAWSVSKGRITTTGLYTAPAVTSNETISVTATSVADPSKSATATVTVLPPVSVAITPTTLTMNSGTTHPFQATVSGSTRNGVTWSVTHGTISGTGSFTAPLVNRTATVLVTATSVADPKVSATSVVTVEPKVSVLTSPDSVSVPSSGSYQFTAMVNNSTNTGVTWTCSVGHISASGLYSAPAVTTDTTAIVTATSSADRTKSSTSTVTVTPIAALSITTASLTNTLVGVNYTGTFSATGGTLPYTWSISWGALPSGITLGSKGALSGSTQQTGAFTFNVHVSDSSPIKLTAKQAFTLTVNLNLAGKSIPATMFNMHINHLSTPWPSAPIAGQRFWGGSDWALVNTAQDVYDWTSLDQRLSDAKLHNVDVLYDMGMTPVWAQCGASTASSCVQSPGCAGGNWGGGDGQCYWPGDLNADGSGTNQHWKDWVTALAKHSLNNGNARIKYYEIWNEPNINGYWRGTTAQLVRMAQDAACIIKGVGPGCTKTAIDPNAMILTPSPALGGGAINTWLTDYLGAGGAQISDIVAFHGYNGTDAEKITSLVANLRDGALTTYALLNKPLFDDEFSWGTAVFPDPDEQAGFVGRSMLLHWSSGVSRVYWYAWEDTTPLWSADSIPGCTTPDSSGTGFTCSTGVAFTQVQSWMVGATLSQQCSATGTVWTCGFTRSGGYQALVVWDTAKTCSNGSCTTSSYKFPPVSPNYTHYLDLTGKSHTISGTTVPIGYKPILLANQ